MGWIRGRPRALLFLFFALAVFLTGSISAISGDALGGGGIWPASTMASLVVALGFALLVLGRILWFTAAVGLPPRENPLSRGKVGRP